MTKLQKIMDQMKITDKELYKLSGVHFNVIKLIRGDSEIRNFHKIISQWKEYLDYQLGVIEE